MRIKPNKELITQLFSNDDEIKTVTRKPLKNSKPKKKKEELTATQKNYNKFEAKLNEELFSEFDHKDWFQYFVYKAREHNVKYLTRNYAKEYAIIKSILNELTWEDLKLMMDFVWDSNQDIVEKPTMGLWILSKGWINSVYQSSLLWAQGKYKPSKAPKRNREWTGQVAEASRKDSGTGLTYGKPIKDKEETPSANKTVIKKGSIRL